MLLCDRSFFLKNSSGQDYHGRGLLYKQFLKPRHIKELWDIQNVCRGNVIICWKQCDTEWIKTHWWRGQQTDGGRSPCVHCPMQLGTPHAPLSQLHEASLAYLYQNSYPVSQMRQTPPCVWRSTSLSVMCSKDSCCMPISHNKKFDDLWPHTTFCPQDRNQKVKANSAEFHVDGVATKGSRAAEEANKPKTCQSLIFLMYSRH